MGVGIGRNCEICGNQLNDEDGFDIDERICNTCEELVPKVLGYLRRCYDDGR